MTIPYPMTTSALWVPLVSVHPSHRKSLLTTNHGTSLHISHREALAEMVSFCSLHRRSSLPNGLTWLSIARTAPALDSKSA